MTTKAEWWAAFRVLHPKADYWQRRCGFTSFQARFFSEDKWNYWNVPYPFTDAPEEWEPIPKAVESVTTSSQNPVYVCPDCVGSGKDGHDRELPPNPYTCMTCGGVGFLPSCVDMGDKAEAVEEKTCENCGHPRKGKMINNCLGCLSGPHKQMTFGDYWTTKQVLKEEKTIAEKAREAQALARPVEFAEKQRPEVPEKLFVDEYDPSPNHGTLVVNQIIDCLNYLMPKGEK